jgi:hypothetical protein
MGGGVQRYARREETRRTRQQIVCEPVNAPKRLLRAREDVSHQGKNGGDPDSKQERSNSS